jgi:hypothetical protein
MFPAAIPALPTRRPPPKAPAAQVRLRRSPTLFIQVPAIAAVRPKQLNMIGIGMVASMSDQSLGAEHTKPCSRTIVLPTTDHAQPLPMAMWVANAGSITAQRFAVPS